MRTKQALWQLLPAALFALLIPSLSLAQQFTFRHYGQDDGLRNPDVFSLVEDDSGLLWAATENGLFRYDGSGFRHFGEQDGLGESLVLALHKDSSGRIWAATNDHLYAFIDDRFVAAPTGSAPMQFGAGQRLASIDPQNILFLARGTLMHLQPAISTAQTNLAHWTAAPYIDSAQTAAHPELTHIHNVFVSPDGHTLWLGCDRAICRVRNGHIDIFDTQKGVPAESWVRFFLDRSGTLWARGAHHIRVLLPGETVFRPRDLYDATHDSTYTGSGLIAFAEDPNHRVLTQTCTGIARWNGNGSAWQTFDASNGIPSKDISTILFDRLGSLWFSTRGHGLFRWQGYGEIENWTTAQGLADDVVWPIFRDRQRRVWIADQVQLTQLDDGATRVRVQPAFAKTPLSRIDGITQSSDGSLWLASIAGDVTRFDPATQRTTFRGKLPSIARVFSDSSHRIWFCTRDGLYVIRDTVHPILEKLTDPLVSSDAFADADESPDHTLWFASDNHLYRLAGSTFTEVPLPDRYTRGQIRNIAAASDGTLWVGGGLPSLLHLSIQGSATILNAVSTPDLVSTDIQTVRLDTRGWLWVGCDLGVNVFDGSHWRLLAQRDGLLSNDTDEGAFLADSDGSVWIGVNGGVVHLLRPEHLFPPTPLNVSLKSASLGDIPLNLDGRRNRWHWRDSPLDVTFTSLNYDREDSLLFRYRLDGLESNWSETPAHSLHYPALPPGDYHFLIQAIDPGQQKQSPVVSLAFTVRPPWWRTRLFYLLLALLSFGLSFLIWKLRERTLIRRQRILRQLVAQRTRELETEKAGLLAAREALHRQATRDALTGLWNRSAILDILHHEMERARREGNDLALVLADIDHFKQINDTFGHLAGDAILREAAARMLHNIRSYDFLGRYGGEEFLLILPGLAPGDPHARLSQIQQAISSAPFHDNGRVIAVTSSFGVAWMAPTTASTEDLLRRADEALYRAKASGRDKIIFYEETLNEHDDQLTN
ncbi:ligand-binding sensor domain-containing diguanylate cyclase [Edaphobacter bradus]|uniref:ligand-binding sensor domain-containing diguanylate cyclase n=1 Tax=Edaphobacter bradus TaxID=2259016 RepID=UPI0021E04A85|nr:ligand-binding sensor domain-containing diguanylate cyclase [Edaphobacter bradus]